MISNDEHYNAQTSHQLGREDGFGVKEIDEGDGEISGQGPGTGYLQSVISGGR